MFGGFGGVWVKADLCGAVSGSAAHPGLGLQMVQSAISQERGRESQSKETNRLDQRFFSKSDFYW